MEKRAGGCSSVSGLVRGLSGKASRLGAHPYLSWKQWAADSTQQELIRSPHTETYRCPGDRLFLTKMAACQGWGGDVGEEASFDAELGPLVLVSGHR